ncbi:ABC-2 transporter permease [Clostridium baratii]|uniref:ABC-2 transporter permease n=1 Tax=Clostridium baratii TaxID=1561 RepID=UPI003D33735B
MFKLVLRDLMIQMKMFFGYVICLIFLTSIFIIGIKSDSITSEEIYLQFNISYLFIIMIFPLNSINYIIAKTTGKRNSINMILRSLPIRSKDIVRSKIGTPLAIFFLYGITSIIPVWILSSYMGEKIISSETILVIFIIFYCTSVFNMVLNLLYPESTMLYYIRIIPVFLIIGFVTLLRKLFLSQAELTLILENLNVVLILLTMLVVAISILSINIVTKKYKTMEI